MVIVADTSVLVEFLQRGNPTLAKLLSSGQVAVHPMAIGELSMGSFATAEIRAATIAAISELPCAAVVAEDALHEFVGSETLFGTGIGYVDAHLLASTRDSGGGIWTHDRRLAREAARLKLRYDPGMD